MRKRIKLFLSSVVFGAFSSAMASEPPVGTQHAPGLEIHRFAGSDLVVHPTGAAIDASGRLLVIESHTHFPPKNYDGPKSDRIVILEDTDGDGVADARRIFFEKKLVATMDIAVHPESGAIYVATRSEILRLWDQDGDGVADEDRIERRLVFLRGGDYPHNGLSGLSFDPDGDLYFGLGENLGAAYKLTGSDGTTIADQGEGGNIFHVDRDGGGLHRIATGFWNPWGVVCTPQGHVFATDNDPSSRPPSRLHYIIRGGDYGYQFRYGRSGRHPFVSWDGELPGTLPMLAGTGEAPCDIIEIDGNLLVASWADHRLEWYPLTATDNQRFSTEQCVLVQGGIDFRPVSFARAKDGAIYVTDWVRKDYQLHGEGAVWVIRGWNPEPRELPTKRPETKAPILPKQVLDPPTDPYEFTRLLSQLDDRNLPAWSLSAAELIKPEHVVISCRIDRRNIIPDALESSDAMVRLLALRWISDARLKEFRENVEVVATNPPTPIDYLAALTALGRIDRESVDDRALTRRIVTQLRDPKNDVRVRQAAFHVIPDRAANLTVDQLVAVFKQADPEDDATRIGVLLTLAEHPKIKGASAAKKVVGQLNIEDLENSRITAFAKLAMRQAQLGAPTEAESSARPSPDAGAASWLEYLGAVESDPDHLAKGRIVFHLACAACHRAEGYGRNGGPDLTEIGQRGREYLMDSILDPSSEIAPQYEPWQITLADNSVYMGFMLSQRGSNHTYADLSGQTRQISNRDIVTRTQLPISMMPPGLHQTMDDASLRAVLDYLSLLRP